MSSERAEEIASDLADGTDEGLRSALVVPTGQELDPAAAEQFAALGPITFDLATFEVIGDRIATVRGRVANPPEGVSENWTFTLMYVDSTWKLLDGIPDA